MKYKKRPTLIEASQWYRNGDHPEDDSQPIDTSDGTFQLTEGKVVRFFRSLNIPGNRVCSACGNIMQKHGALIQEGTGEDVLVCPSDYIITSTDGFYYKMPAQAFEAVYEPHIE